MRKTIQVDEDVHEKLKRIASVDKISISEVIRNLLKGKVEIDDDYDESIYLADSL